MMYLVAAKSQGRLIGYLCRGRLVAARQVATVYSSPSAARIAAANARALADQMIVGRATRGRGPSAALSRAINQVKTGQTAYAAARAEGLALSTIYRSALYKSLKNN